MDMDRLTRSARGSSIRVSSSTRKRVALLVAKLKASSQQDVIDQALAQLEHRVFWEGFEEEAKAYLRSEEHTSELQSLRHLVCRLLLEKKKLTNDEHTYLPVYQGGSPLARQCRSR